ncbi:hypothetical protein DL1_11365 [Thioclava dalianensis]|uniref:Uncharacterized protein n=1 Tax=Thioclava dalianensis TaxID=1185766 RepID=A0A074TA14_9RHOB|nr:hypothetical protein [Thioclava dalianensis]KEP68544.1 hypothetical protein DL1_11365 [Thioclava dalianensis]SFN84306.1 hypothetical protein SAMN05216224_11724 [Thioclava dalianensis]
MSSEEYIEIRAIIEAKAVAHRMAMSFIIQAVEKLTQKEVSPSVAKALTQIREGNLMMIDDEDPLRAATDEELENIIDMLSSD